MVNLPSSVHPAVSASTIRDDKFDICFVDKKGYVSLGNSLEYGDGTPAPSTIPSLLNRSTTGANENIAITTVTGPSIGMSIHESHHQTGKIPPANDSSQNNTSGGPIAGSNRVPEDSLVPDHILVAGESTVAKLPDDSYFTLIWLDRFYEVKAAPKSEGKDQPDRQISKKDITLENFSEMDHSYAGVLKSLGLCGHCKDQVQKILWRNIREYESRYESRCRTCEDENGVCFLKFHTMQAPYLNESNFILALVHHVKIPKTLLEQGGGYGDPEEHIFVFVLGLLEAEIGKLFTSLRFYWETTSLNPVEVGLTTRLFLAAVLKLYGFRVAQNSILDSFGKLEDIGEELIKLKDTLEGEVESSKGKAVLLKTEGKKKMLTEEEELKLKTDFELQMQNCTSLNFKLMKMDKALPGVRSRVHYVSLCAQGLLRDQSGIQEYIREHLTALNNEKKEKPALNLGGGELSAEEGLSPPRPSDSAASGTVPKQNSVEQVIRALSSSRYKRRDDDKLDMLNRSMQQFEIDIKSLKARANIAIGLVATEYARSQGNFQSLVIQATERDGSIMRVIATITIYLLPATFLALFFTTPMIQWAKPVVQLASDTPNSIMDTGSPIFVFIPLFLWLGLSAFSSFWLWARLEAKKEQKATLPWLIEMTITRLSQLIKKLFDFRKARTKVKESAPGSDGLYLKGRPQTSTLTLERGLNETTNTHHGTSRQSGVGRENPEVQTPMMSGARGSGESTLSPRSVDDTEEIQMLHLKPALHKTHE